MSHSNDVTEKLNELLEKNYDAEKGFQNAADDVKNERLKAFFGDKARQRYDFGHELKAEISKFGGTPDKGTSVKGDVHRAWMDLKSALTSDKEEEVLEEAIRGEKAALEEYNEAINEKELPPSTANLLIKQRNAIERTLQEVKGLEEAFD
ncbi:ferritin-like domain-containing protein [Salinimicrobium gaetbulicola]|uniref:PA2169 family four-helix-bundle protein n=1 Tax=Salinimicrobium gaetbulicola TaxID=999702 RepID=A0ABW3IHR0_9FLAO